MSLSRKKSEAVGPPTEDKRTTRELPWHIKPSSKPFAASAIAPGPFRGWGRKPLACIHTQREPVVPPAGTGTEYPRPKGPPHGSRGGKASGSPS